MKLPKDFYIREDVVQISKDLLGKVLFTRVDNQMTAGIIVETEAYCGRNDRACHANNKRTKRTEVMYGPGGHAYVYLCYGMYSLFNIVTNVEGLADAVLIRGVEPLEGIDTMLQRRRLQKNQSRLTAGPGVLTIALGIDRRHYGENLQGNTIWLEDHDIRYKKNEILSSPRVGVDYAGKDALRPWRFRVKGNEWCSKGR